MAAVVVQPHFLFGLRSGVKNNLCFCDEHTVVFPGGSGCVSFNTASRTQRFLPGSDGGQGVEALAISANRRYLAVSESGERPAVTVFDLHHEQGRKRKVLTAGEASAQQVVCLAFSPDSKYLIAQAGPPDWTLFFWLWEKHKVLATVKTTTSSSPVTQISFSPHNNMQLSVSGRGVFKIFRYFEGSIKQSSFAKVESLNFLCHAWMAAETLIAGTESGRLLVFESGHLRREVNTTSPDRRVEMKKIREEDEGPAFPPIRTILSFSRGFVCSLAPGTVCLFEKMEEQSYRRSQDIQIPAELHSDLGPAEDQNIDSLCLSPSEETLAVSTERRLYSFNLASLLRAGSTDSSSIHNTEKPLYFHFLSEPLHSGSITGLSVCVRKPLVATSSLDRSVRIWNYHTRMLELSQQFQQEALSVSLHPTGFFILVGFSDKLRLMNLLMDQMRKHKDFNVRGCRECAFSHGGHMFAAVNGNVVHIYSFSSLENVLNLTGHSGKVRSIKWSLDDGRLVSCGMDGAVYQWNAHTGKRESESVLKSCGYTDVAFSWDRGTVIAVGTDRTLKEIQDCQVLREVPADEVAHTVLAVSRSGRMVFTGTSRGTIRAIKYPLPLQKDWTTYQAHCSPVTKVVLSSDEHFLLSGGEDGGLFLWKIVDQEGGSLKSRRLLPLSDEVLVSKAHLEEQQRSLQELQLVVEEVQKENQYRLHLKELSCSEKIKVLNQQFLQQTQSLEATQQELRTRLEKEDRDHQEKMSEAAIKHSKELKDLESSVLQQLLSGQQQLQQLQQELQRRQAEYQGQLTAAEQTSVQQGEQLRRLQELHLQEKAELLEQCGLEAQQQLCEVEARRRRVEEELERKVEEVQVQYEKKLQAERESSAHLKGRAGVLSQKVHSLQRQMEERWADVDKLKKERQRLLGLIRSLEGDVGDLRRQISGLQRTGQDKDDIITGLKKKNQEVEKLRFVLDFQLSEMKKEAEPQQDDIREKKQKIQELEEELLRMGRSHQQLTLSAANLTLKLKSNDKELQTERLRVKHLETHLQRLLSDLHTCVGFIQEPRKLQDAVQDLYTRYVRPANGVSIAQQVRHQSVNEELRKVFYQQQDFMEKTVNNLKTRLERTAVEHQQVYNNIMEENMALIGETNQLRKELHQTRSHVKDYKTQLAVLKRPSRLRPLSAHGTAGGSKGC